MTRPTDSQSSGHSHWKQCWRSHNSCCSKGILLLLVWQGLFTFSSWLLKSVGFHLNHGYFHFVHISELLSALLAPFIGWLAGVKLGRYEIIKFASMSSFFCSIIMFFALLLKEPSAVSSFLILTAVLINGFGGVCFQAGVLPFITDQLVGATSDKLSAVVQWYYWVESLSFGLSYTAYSLVGETYFGNTGVTVAYALFLSLIIISDCLCQQWLDKTHKVTNPIKLIIQVLNYTRKHRYPERRSAFTYLDEEQPSRIDFGKEKFGGPFTEEEVEDVKTVLRLIPLMICLIFGFRIVQVVPQYPLKAMPMLSTGIKRWFIPATLIPIYRLILRPFIHSRLPSMLKCAGVGFLMMLTGYVLLEATGIWGAIISNSMSRYLTCTRLLPNMTGWPEDHINWYWKLGPFIIYSFGQTIMSVLTLEFIIAQSPDKMKGLTIGIIITFEGIVNFIVTSVSFLQYTLCFDVSTAIIAVVLFAVFLLLSKWYTLRERNREINIQAIVEEHYERYMDQEEEYMRQHGGIS